MNQHRIEALGFAGIMTAVIGIIVYIGFSLGSVLMAVIRGNIGNTPVLEIVSVEPMFLKMFGVPILVMTFVMAFVVAYMADE